MFGLVLTNSKRTGVGRIVGNSSLTGLWKGWPFFIPYVLERLDTNSCEASDSRPAAQLEFRRELRFEAAAGLFELSFSPRHVSQQCVQLLRTLHHQSEHEYEQDFGTKTHDSPLDHALVVGDGGCDAGRLFFVSFHGCLEAANALSNSFAKFG